MKVDIFIPCFVDQLYPDTAFSMIKVLEKAGCQVHYNPRQTCCSQPAYNAGFWNQALEVGEKFVHDFNEAEYVVAPSASCTGYVRNIYGELFRNSSIHNQTKALQQKTYELSEFLVDVMNVVKLEAKLEGKATFHDSCSALRECSIKAGPRQLLEHVEGLELIEMEDVETCCGFGGTFAVKYEPISTAMAEQKLEHALATGADYLISTDWSCLMHLEAMIKRRSYPLRCLHLADVLASGY